MRYVTIGFVVVYLILVTLYLRPPRPEQKHGRVWNKTVLALSYFIYAAVAVFFARHFDDSTLLVVLLALAFCMAGDIVIQYHFICGAVLFFVANLINLGFQLWSLSGLNLAFRNVWWFVPAAIIPLTIVAELQRRNWLKLGHLAPLAILYLSSVTFSGMLGIAVALSSGLCSRCVLGTGLALYMISDYFLIYREFRKSRRIAQMGNTLTYFIGMMLVALSLRIL